MDIMISLLSGVAIWLLTELAKYLTKRTGFVISTKIIVAFFCIIAGGIYYYLQAYSPLLLESMGKFVLGAFASSQVIWMILEKYLKDLNTQGKIESE